MPKKIAIIMDPLEKIQVDKDTTFALALESQRRGQENWIVYLEDFLIQDAKASAYARQVEFKRASPCFKILREKTLVDLDEFDYVLMRKDPPFDEAYFFASHFLSLLKAAKVLNRQSGLREAPEKIYSLHFPQVIPPTLISSDASEIKKFMSEQGGEIILKPLNRCGGSGILYVKEGDKNFYSMVELSTKDGKEWIMAQKYLKEIKQGDKRIILVNGEAKGAITRIPSADEHRGNIHVGGIVRFSNMTARDLWLVDQIKDQLKKDGLFFVGLDVIGDWITEINVTSPTGIQEIKNLGGIDIAEIFWDEVEKFKG
ncbi:MAG: glutathione synthase [Deltaproteobacteria bacterium]|nr:glutathione synthase [Deltaproteobacteria bacterium]